MNVAELKQELLALRGELAQFRLLADTVPVAIAYYEALDNTCRFANRRYARMFGFEPEAVVGRSFTEIIGEPASRAIEPYRRRVLQGLESVTYERAITGRDGEPLVLEVSMLPHCRDDGGLAVGAFVLISDITHHRLAEAALRESEERLAKFMLASEEGICFHKGGYITDVNPPLLALLGYTAGEMNGRAALDFIAPDERAKVSGVMAAAAEVRYDSVALHRDGTPIPVQFIVRSMLYQGEQHRMTIVRDLRDRIEAERRIHHLAHHDALTGLPNRLAFGERVEARLAAARARGQALALMFIDLDHFKRVNDSLGHPVGDVLLRTVADRLSETLRTTDLVARFGGDEFMVLLSPRAGEVAVAEVASRLLAAVGAPLEVEGVTLSVMPSIGVAQFPRDGESAETLIKHADLAMYRAKQHGRARCRFFEPWMAEVARDELAMESRLARAIVDEEFVLHFQPQVSLVDGRLVGVEALLRWAHPERGLIYPDAFIPLAENRRLILPIGHWVLRQALAAAVRWQRAGLLDVPVAVNLSTLQFQAAGFADGIERLLEEAGATGPQLELELTERMLMDDLDGVRHSLQRLKAIGVLIAVDDFGTGFTSLAHLKELPLDRLKIDRSFILDLPGDRGAAAVARAIVQMGHGLGLEVLAEGVESAAQRQWARDEGCDGMQGYVLAAPMEMAEMERWLQRQGEAALA